MPSVFATRFAVARSGADLADVPQASDVEELPGMGLRGTVNGAEVLAGNRKLFDSRGIALPEQKSDLNCVYIAVNGKPSGCFLLRGSEPRLSRRRRE